MNSTTEIIRQVSTIKERVEALDNAGRLYYEIFAYIPNASNEYQSYGRGGNSKGEKIYKQFASDLDRVLNNPDLAKIKVNLKNNRKDFGSMEMTIKEAYANHLPAVRPLEKTGENRQQKMDFQDDEPTKPQQNMNNQNFMTVLGQAFLGVSGLSGVGNDETGLGTIMAIQEKVIGDRYEKQQQADKLFAYAQENATLKAQIGERNTEIANLQKSLTESEDRIDELEAELDEYEKLNPDRDIISGIGKEIFSGLAVGFAKKTKIGGLFGLENDDNAANSASPQTGKNTNVQISEATEITDEILLFVNSLNPTQQTEFQQLVRVFQQDISLIKACLHSILNANN